MIAEPCTDDRMLGGRVRLRQPKHGFRAAIDAVLLAAAVPARAGERVLDLGTGTGAAALCLAARLEGVAIVGLEVDPAAAGLAADNAGANGFAARIAVVAGDVLAPPEELFAQHFDHVMANPPHLTGQRARPSPVADRARASFEDVAGLGDWVDLGVATVRPGGTVTLIHRADRLDALLAALAKACGDLIVFPLWPGPTGRPAKRVIVAGRKGARGPLRLLPGLVLHRADGRFTDAAEAVLRGAAALGLHEPA